MTISINGQVVEGVTRLEATPYANSSGVHTQVQCSAGGQYLQRSTRADLNLVICAAEPWPEDLPDEAYDPNDMMDHYYSRGQ